MEPVKRPKRESSTDESGIVQVDPMGLQASQDGESIELDAQVIGLEIGDSSDVLTQMRQHTQQQLLNLNGQVIEAVRQEVLAHKFPTFKLNLTFTAPEKKPT